MDIEGEIYEELATLLTYQIWESWLSPCGDCNGYHKVQVSGYIKTNYLRKQYLKNLEKVLRKFDNIPLEVHEKGRAESINYLDKSAPFFCNCIGLQVCHICNLECVSYRDDYPRSPDDQYVLHCTSCDEGNEAKFCEICAAKRESEIGILECSKCHNERINAMGEDIIDE